MQQRSFLDAFDAATKEYGLAGLSTRSRQRLRTAARD